MSAIVLENLALQIGAVRVIENVSATIGPSGVTALIGPNGAGKSVTLRILDGLLTPTRGCVRFGRDAAPRRAFVFQRPALIRASAAANVALALAPLGLSRRERTVRTEAALARVGLGQRAGAPATKLSGGEQQRLALARAWAVEPRLLLLDEPTANLDPAATQAVEAIVAAMAGSGIKILLVSHNLGQVTRLADDVLVLSAGRTVEHGPTRQVLFAPRAPETRAYLAGELPWRSYAAAC